MRVSWLGLTLIAACGDPLIPEPAPVRVTMVERLNTPPFRTVITVTNQGDSPIYLGGCSVWIQARIGGEWRTVYSPTCVGVVTTVEPGGNHVREFSFLPSEDYPPQDSYRPALAYRISPAGEEITVYGPAIDR